MMRLTLTLALLASLLPPCLREHSRGAAAAPGSAWTDDEYTPRPGHWKPYVLSRARARWRPHGARGRRARRPIVGDPSSALREDGRSVRLTASGSGPGPAADARLRAGGRRQGPVHVDRERLTRARSCTRASASRAATWRSARATTARPRSLRAATRPTSGSASRARRTPRTATAASSTSTARRTASAAAGSASDALPRRPRLARPRRRVARLHARGGQGPDLSRYAGTFLSSDDGSNKAWYAGAYTVQLNTDSPASAKSWPYEAGERDHADNPVPHADPGAD